MDPAPTPGSPPETTTQIVAVVVWNNLYIAMGEGPTGMLLINARTVPIPSIDGYQWVTGPPLTNFWQTVKISDSSDQPKI